MPSDPVSKAGQQFAAAMQGAASQARSAADEFTRMFAGLKFPAMPDSEALLAAQKRNIEALTRANQVAMEGAQAIARRHLEIVQQSMAEMGEQVRTLATAEAPQAKAAKQAELLKRSYEQAVEHARELSQLIQRTNGEALDMLNQRFIEAMDEVKALMATSRPEDGTPDKPGG
jgi:phasin family protein